MQKQQYIYGLVLLFLISIIFQSSIFAKSNEEKYIFDKNKALTQEQKEGLLKLIEEVRQELGEIVFVYTEQSALPSEDEILKEFEEIKAQDEYGKKEGEDISTCYIWINKNEDDYFSLYFCVGFCDELQFKKYSFYDIRLRVEEELNKSKDLVKAVQMTSNLELEYLFPIVTDLSQEILSPKQVDNACYNLIKWEHNKELAIKMLWKKQLSQELREDYLENYFPSLFYTKNTNGMFILCDESANYLGIQMYGNLKEKYSEAQKNSLEETLKIHMKNYDVNEMAKSVMAFLDSKEYRKNENEKADLHFLQWNRVIIQGLTIAVVLIIVPLAFVGLVIMVERKRQEKNKKENSRK